MTISATCPKGHALTLEEKMAGKRIRCPRCQSVFQVPDLDNDSDDGDEAVSEKPLRRGRAPKDDEEEKPSGKARRPVPDDDDDDEDEEMDPETKKKLQRRIKKKQLKLVDVGLLLHLIKLYMYVAGMLFLIASGIMVLIAGAQASARVGEAAKGQEVEPGGGFVIFGFAIVAVLFAAVYFFLFEIGPLLGMVGSFLCCWVPKKSETRGTIVLSLTFDLVCFLCDMLRWLAIFNVFGFDEPGKTERMIYLLRAINIFCLISSWLTFLTFLRGLGKYLGEPGVGNEALNLIARLVVQIISLIGNVIINVACAFMLGGINPFLAIAVGILFIVIWFVFFIFGFCLRLIKLISAMRRAVQNKL